MRHSQRPVFIRECTECGVVFNTLWHNVTRCGNEPCDYWHIRTSALMRYASKHGAQIVERVHPLEVLERDNYTCRRCGEPIVIIRSNALEAEQFSIDHIIPLDSKGAHTIDNLASTHMRCNSEKGHKVTAREMALTATSPVV